MKKPDCFPFLLPLPIRRCRTFSVLHCCQLSIGKPHCRSIKSILTCIKNQTMGPPRFFSMTKPMCLPHDAGNEEYVPEAEKLLFLQKSTSCFPSSLITATLILPNELFSSRADMKITALVRASDYRFSYCS